MNKPYFFDRPTGRFVRFLLPRPLQLATGRRFIVRKLPRSPIEADLLVAGVNVALSQATRLYERTGLVVDFNETLKKLRSGKVDELLLEDLTLPNGTKINRVEINTDEDKRLFNGVVEDIGRVAPEEPHRATQAPSGALLLDTAIKGYISDIERQELAKKTLIESRHSLRLLLGITGNIPVSDLSIQHMRTFLDEVKYYPRNASLKAEWKNLTVKQAIAKSKKQNNKPLAIHTQQKHFSRVSVFLNSLVANGDIPRNPISSLSLPKAKNGKINTGRAFTTEELQMLFDKEYLPWAKKHPYKFWGVLLCMYSGARVNEIAQLYKKDFEEVAGFWGFHIHDKAKDQRIKNNKSRRFVPVHSVLIEAGFLEWLEQIQTPRLFQSLTYSGESYGTQISKAFSRYIKKRGIKGRGGIHGFRHTLATYLFDKGIPLEEIALITGHSDNKTPTVLETFYVEKVQSKIFLRAREVLEQYQPKIEIPTYEEWKHFKK